MQPQLRIATPVAALLVLAVARRASADDATPPPSTPAFLEVRSSWSGSYGLEFSGPVDGPGFLAWDMVDAVRGSPTAERHARRARGWAVAGFGLSLASAGLLVADGLRYADRGDLGGWPDFVGPAGDRGPTLALGALIALAGAVVSRYMTYEAITLSVNAYNRDWARGRGAPAGGGTTVLRF